MKTEVSSVAQTDMAFARMEKTKDTLWRPLSVLKIYCHRSIQLHYETGTTMMVQQEGWMYFPESLASTFRESIHMTYKTW